MEIPAFTLKTGTKIPAIGLGTWQLSGKACADAVKAALRLGYTHFDTAEMYENQEQIGAAIKGVERKRLFITSKVWHANLGYEDTLAACEQTLKQLGTNYLDLYLIHWPNQAIPMQQTFRALEELHRAGKIKALGVSNFTIGHLKEAMQASSVPLAVNQVEFHPFLNQQELLDFCKKSGIVLTAYSPLARGRVNDDLTIQAIAEKHAKTPGQTALRWCFQKGLVAIPKASSEAHLRENLAIFDFELDKADMRALDALPQHRIVNPAFAEFE